MKNRIKNFFANPRKKVAFICIVVAVVLVLCAGTVFAATMVKNSVIGKDAACNYAYADAGVDPVSAVMTKAEFDYENGEFLYDIEFYVDGTEYEYWIKASDGTVLKREIDIETVSGNTVTVTAQITIDDARNVALSDAGLDESQVTFTTEKLDYDNGLSIYEIDFYTENVEYEYEINAETGAVYSRTKETFVTEETTETSSNGTDTGGDTDDSVGTDNVDTEKASVTGTTENANVTDTTENNTISNTVTTEETTTESTTTESTTTESTITESITVESITTESTTTESTNNSSGNDVTRIDTASAKNIALSDAGVASSDATFTKTKLDYDDGIEVYEIEFYTVTAEYDYEIKASDGTILEKSSEIFEMTDNTNKTEKTDSTGNSNSTDTADSYISADKAKSIALNKAGLSASDVTFTKTKLEKDDGIMVYEIEFYKGKKEYECTINAISGTIIEYDVDTDD